MQSNMSPTSTTSQSAGFIPIDPAKKAALHWTEERKRRVPWTYAWVLIMMALIAGVVIGQLIPQFLG